MRAPCAAASRMASSTTATPRSTGAPSKGQASGVPENRNPQRVQRAPVAPPSGRNAASTSPFCSADSVRYTPVAAR